MTTFRRYCICGAKVEAASEPRNGADFIVAAFERIHSGPGHAATDAATARKARAREDGAR